MEQILVTWDETATLKRASHQQCDHGQSSKFLDEWFRKQTSWYVTLISVQQKVLNTAPMQGRATVAITVAPATAALGTESNKNNAVSVLCDFVASSYLNVDLLQIQVCCGYR